ncbi:MAG TPA: ABC-type transport auxiliary lipoprotein family protein [Thiohalobacter sp.]|nr:ABC-type transport auxiliary lipoprotein family protein [Thiohalobacter sp.]
MKALTGTGVWTALLTALWLAGCAVLPEPRTPVAYDHYTLTAAPAEPPLATTRAPLTLLLPPLRMRGGQDGTRMAYRRQPGQLDFYARSRWVEPPSQLLHVLLLERFTREGPYAHVVDATTPVAADQRLDIEVLEFLQDFTTTPSLYRVRLRLTLVDLGQRRVRLQELMQAEVPAPDDSPQGGAAAAGAAVNALFERIRARLQEVVPDDA